MKKVVITGFSLAVAPNITGIQRVCRELLLRLDKLLENEELAVEYVYPEKGPNRVIPPEEFRNIKPVPLKKPFWAKKFLAKFWIVRRLNRYAKRGNAIGCCLSLEWPFGERNLSFLYDLRPVAEKYDRPLFRLKYAYYLRRCRRGCTLFLTDSDYQKKLICDRFKCAPERVETVYPGWEHMRDVQADGRVFERFPQLKAGGFYYTLGSLAPHKNFKWIAEVAARNPKELFVIAGGKDLKIWKDSFRSPLANVLLVGRVTDGESKALMEHCKAFLFPSKFEGFGIPPLEALSCGAEVACSDATCLPEVYEDCVHYFDPDDYGVSLEKLLGGPVAPPRKILEKCSWDRAAEKLLALLKAEAGK